MRQAKEGGLHFPAKVWSGAPYALPSWLRTNAPWERILFGTR
jgi:hypothetical protein